MDFQKVIHSINLTSPSWDLYVLIIFILGIYFFVFRWGRDRAFLILLGSYVSLAFVSKLALIEKTLGINLPNTFIDKALLFFALMLAVYWIFFNTDFISVGGRGPKSAWFQILVISFLEIGLIISVVVSFLTPIEAKSLSIFLKAVFVDGGAQTFWLIAPLLATLLIKER